MKVKVLTLILPTLKLCKIYLAHARKFLELWGFRSAPLVSRMRHRPWSWLLSKEMARRMYILFTIQSLQRGISHRSCSQKGHLGRWVVGWGVVLRVDIGIGSLPPLLLGFHTRSVLVRFWDCWQCRALPVNQYQYHPPFHKLGRGCAKVVLLTDGPARSGPGPTPQLIVL